MTDDLTPLPDPWAAEVPADEIPATVIQAVAEQLRADYDSEHDASHLRWQDFEAQARQLLHVAAGVPATWTPPLRHGNHSPLYIWACQDGRDVMVAVAQSPAHAARLITLINEPFGAGPAPAREPQTPTQSDLRQRYAEALAEKFTTQRRDGTQPSLADRTEWPPYVVFTAEDGYASSRTPSCAELAELCAAVRDEEMTDLRERLDLADRLMKEMAGLTALRHRADRAEADNNRVRNLAGAWLYVQDRKRVAKEILAALDEQAPETRNPAESPSGDLPGSLHSPTGPRNDRLPEADFFELEAHHD